MKRTALSLAFIIFCLSFTSAQESDSPDTQLPCYTALQEAVYTTSASFSEVDELYRAAKEEASKSFTGEQKLTHLSFCDFAVGMNFYYHGKEDEARDAFDSGIKNIRAAMKIKETAENTAHYAHLLFHRASVSSFPYQIRWVPSIPGIAEKSLKLDPSYVPALVIKYGFDCLIPWPYGDYKQGVKDMTKLIQSGKVTSKEDDFFISGYTAYALEQLDRYSEAVSWYKRALESYPGNIDTEKNLKGAQKKALKK
ncbi:MAG: hypothetical protein J5780_06555 [Treponema sp.]|nr:hypothetical protein [Treponema sp.]